MKASIIYRDVISALCPPRNNGLISLSLEQQIV